MPFSVHFINKFPCPHILNATFSYVHLGLRLIHRSDVPLRFSKQQNIVEVLLSMPKDPKHVAEAQKQRKRIKEKNSRYTPGRVTLQVLGTGAYGAPAALYVFTDHSRYLFNCGEGTQRLAHEHHAKLAKLEHIFFTHNSWRNIGGLPGAALTIQDVGVPEVQLHGAPGLEEIFAAARSFVILNNLRISMAKCLPDTPFQDIVLSVNYVPIERSHSRRYTNGSCGAAHMDIEPDAMHTASTLDGACDIAMNYVCKLQPRSGALLLHKCVEYGVPAGPLLGKLKAHEDVTLADGRLVRAADVCEPDDPGPVFLVVDCPSIEYLDAFTSNVQLQRYQSAKPHTDPTSVQQCAEVVIHFTDQSVFDTVQYRAWINDFYPNSKHIVLNGSNTCMGSVAVHRIQCKLNLLSDSCFPLLAGDGINVDVGDPPSPFKRLKIEEESIAVLDKDAAAVSTAVDTPCIIRPKTMLAYNLRPHHGADERYVAAFDPNQCVEECMNLPQFGETLNTIQTDLSNCLSSTAYPEFVFLGTGSSIPNKTRNTSAILMNVTADKSILLDCGEGTLGQLVRLYGADRTDRILANMSAVYVSHLHADHHLGLIALLRRRDYVLGQQSHSNHTNIAIGSPVDSAADAGGAQPLLLMAPAQIDSWLRYYDRHFERIAPAYRLLPNGQLLALAPNDEADREERAKLMSDKYADLLTTLQMRAVRTCHVRHCSNAFGITFDLASGHRITYSGDTMPCDRLIRMGADSDVLIHEATMEDDLLDEAVHKLHSTTSQAIEVGQRMRAKRIILTHFSQRYAKAPRFNDNMADNVCIAFDNMQVNIEQLKWLPKLHPILKLMFAEQYDDMEQRAAKRQLKKERQARNMEAAAMQQSTSVAH